MISSKKARLYAPDRGSRVRRGAAMTQSYLDREPAAFSSLPGLS
jgi:hypothetical protein